MMKDKGRHDNTLFFDQENEDPSEDTSPYDALVRLLDREAEITIAVERSTLQGRGRCSTGPGTGSAFQS